MEILMSQRTLGSAARQITVPSDRTAPRDLAKIMSKPDAVRSAFEASHEALPIELSINCFLIDTGGPKNLSGHGAPASSSAQCRVSWSPAYAPRATARKRSKRSC
jgi:hypothetical protein